MAGMPIRAAKAVAEAASTAKTQVVEPETHPAWYFIQYLLLQLDDPTLESVNATLALHDLGPCTATCLARAFQQVNPIPAEFAPASRTHAATRTYLRRLRVASLFHPEAATEEMRDRILGNGSLRRRIETLLLGRLSAVQVARKLSQADAKISPDAVDEFRHYFWNTEEMTLSGWTDYLAGETGRLPRVTGAAFTAALFCGPEVAMHRAGLSRNIDTQSTLEMMARELDATFREIQVMPLSPQKVEMMTATIRTMLRVDERRQESDSALQDVLHRFERFRMKTDQKRLPTLGTLAPAGSIGDYSRDEIRMARREDT